MAAINCVRHKCLWQYKNLILLTGYKHLHLVLFQNKMGQNDREMSTSSLGVELFEFERTESICLISNSIAVSYLIH